MLDELWLWVIFHCLARSLLVLDRGSEDPKAKHWNKEICHFDIKIDNGKLMHWDVFIIANCGSLAWKTCHGRGAYEYSTVYSKPTLPDRVMETSNMRLQMADFGLSEFVPRDQSSHYIKKRSGWGTRQYYPPVSPLRLLFRREISSRRLI